MRRFTLSRTEKKELLGIPCHSLTLAGSVRLGVWTSGFLRAAFRVGDGTCRLSHLPPNSSLHLPLDEEAEAQGVVLLGRGQPAGNSGSRHSNPGLA